MPLLARGPSQNESVLNSAVSCWKKKLCIYFLLFSTAVLILTFKQHKFERSFACSHKYSLRAIGEH